MTQNNLPAKILMTVLVILGSASCKKPVYYNISTSVQPVGSGSIVATPSSNSVLEGTSVSFKASPNGDYVFTGWSGSLSGTDNPATVVASSDLNIVANFQLREYPLTLSVEGEGSIQERVVSTKTDYPSGTVVELTAKAADHWLFDHWEGDMTGKENPAKISISAAKTVKAVFVKKMYDLTVTVEGEGAIQEKVVETKGSYQEGTVVELTATPATGWSFDHWEGDLSGTENPSQITVSAAKAVKAVFTKNKYAYNLKIVGPGVVDEYLVENTKASLDYGTQVLLKAIPSEGAVFKGWGGDASGDDMEIVINLNDNKDIIASFANAKQSLHYPLPDLMQPSSKLKKLYYGIDFLPYCQGTEPIVSDYNRDGYIDMIIAATEYEGQEEIRFPVRFYLGDENGYFTIDDNNDSRITSTSTRKVIQGDYNGDGYPDFCLLGHGYDAPPYPGDYPIVLLSQNGPYYKDIRFTDCISFHHGGASGDIDNDGDLDIVLVSSWHGNILFFINDGKGNFEVKTDLIDQELRFGIYSCELYDVDNDGFLDFCLFGERTIIVWGNGQSYNHSDYSVLPNELIEKYGGVVDSIFIDLDNDGVEEVMLLATGPEDGKWHIEVLKRKTHSFIDVTDIFFGDDYHAGPDEGWVPWMDIDTIDDNQYLLIDLGYTPNIVKKFKWANGQFIRYKEEPMNRTIKDGLVIYDDKPESEFFDGSATGDPYNEESIYSGKMSLKIDGGWDVWSCPSFSYAESLDISSLVDDYCFEFAIKNADPSLYITFAFESDNEGNDVAYGYRYDYYGTDFTSNGDWEIIRLPLKSFIPWETNNPNTNYWNSIKKLQLSITSNKTEQFFLDEIRIRKVLPDNQ